MWPDRESQASERFTDAATTYIQTGFDRAYLSLKEKSRHCREKSELLPTSTTHQVFYGLIQGDEQE